VASNPSFQRRLAARLNSNVEAVSEEIKMPSKDLKFAREAVFEAINNQI
jgi:hypothetical protein